jgi:hypothetical protein
MNLKEGRRQHEGGKSVRAQSLSLWAALVLLAGAVGCNVMQPSDATAKPKQEEHSAQSTGGAQRFVFPSQSTPFPAASVALDTRSGQLCKTYPWPDTKTLPGGLPLCSDATCPTVASLTGATTAYLGFTYTFNGSKWVKGSKAQSYNPKTQDLDPWSADQYDPLGLFSKEEKAKHQLTKPEIQAVADKFRVTYQEALQDAKNQGYQVPK